MLRKTFDFFLVVFVVVFTAAGAVLVVSGLRSLVPPTQAGGAATGGIFGVAGGVSNRAFSIFVALILSLLVFGVFLITRRIKR